MTKTNHKKLKLQKKAVLKWVSNGRNGTLAMCTGSGKSKCALDVISLFKKEEKKRLKVAVIVPTEKLRDNNWPAEFKKWLPDFDLSQVTFLCYASANKIKGKTFDLVVIDEGHNITPSNKIFFSNNKCLSVLGLTATPPRDKEKMEILNEIAPIVFKYDLDQGVKDGVVAPYEITVIYTSLDNKTKNIEAGSKAKPFMTTEKGNYDYLTKSIGRMMYAGPKMKNALRFKLLARMRFIYNLPSKTKAAQWLLDNVLDKNDKTLIFCGSKNQAEKLCDDFYHSSSGEESFDKFVSDEITWLSCVEKLNEGMNISNMNSALIVQLNSNKLNLIQRIGRIVRFRKGHIGKIYILVCRGTKDEDWAMKALESFDQSNIKHVDIKNYGLFE